MRQTASIVGSLIMVDNFASLSLLAGESDIRLNDCPFLNRLQNVGPWLLLFVVRHIVVKLVVFCCFGSNLPLVSLLCFIAIL